LRASLLPKAAFKRNKLLKEDAYYRDLSLAFACIPFLKIVEVVARQESADAVRP
jgi:hypothetical protein